MINFQAVLQTLAQRRPLFHSEADFQLAFAWEIQRANASARVRLETPISGMPGRGAIDVLVHDGDIRIGFELKYLKLALEYEHEGDTFRLRKTGANDLARYDICKDIFRLEHMVGSRQINEGFVIALTNDPNLWRAEIRATSIDAAFQLAHGRDLQGELAWAAHAGPGTKRGRESSLGLAGNYPIAWQEYSRLPARNGEFRLLIVPVTTSLPMTAPSLPDGAPLRKVGPHHSPRAEGRAALQHFFHESEGSEVVMSFSEVEAYYGLLPPSAHVHKAWWCHVASHADAVWEHEGFFAAPDLGSRQVIFRRR